MWNNIHARWHIHLQTTIFQLNGIMAISCCGSYRLVLMQPIYRVWQCVCPPHVERLNRMSVVLCHQLSSEPPLAALLVAGINVQHNHQSPTQTSSEWMTLRWDKLAWLDAKRLLLLHLTAAFLSDIGFGARERAALTSHICWVISSAAPMLCMIRKSRTSSFVAV